jgi:hypothetical protein
MIDGVLDEEAWKHAKVINDFLQQEPKPGNYPGYKTEVKLLYDENNLYVGVNCFDDEPDKIIAREMKWDGKMSGDDNFQIIFDTFKDNKTAYWFGTNPLGMHDDALLTGFEMNGFNESWNGVWDVRSKINSDGWSIEWIFPFSTFKFHEKDEQVWGINFHREIKRTGEVILWSSVGMDKGFFKISHAGNLIGIKNIKRGNPVYLKPFFSFGKETGENVNKNIYKPGLDVKYGITNNLSLDLSFNTDFAQVESDRARINLSRFPLFFPEKRDFFLEGSSIFDFNLGGSNRIFYSRRIGLTSGEEIPIIGGVKLIGKINNNEVGLISMQTSKKQNTPTTNFSVARTKFGFLKQSHAGFLITSIYSKESFNRVYAGDVNFSFNDFWGDKNLIIQAGFAKSDDKFHAKNSWAGKLVVDYPNDLIDSYFAYRFLQNNFNPAMGFVSRNGIQVIEYGLQIMPRINWNDIKKLEFVPIGTHIELDDNGNMLTGEFSIQPFGFKTNWNDQFAISFSRRFEKVEKDFEIFGDKEIELGDYWFNFIEADFESSPGRIVYGFVDGRFGSFYNGSRNEFETSIIFTVSKNLTLAADYTLNKIKLKETSFSTSEVGSTLRYDFSTQLNTSVFTQWNNEENEINFNYRFNWQPKIGSNLYIVVNHLLSTERKMKSKDLTIIAKFVWMIIV